MHSLADRWPNLYYGYIIIIDVTHQICASNKRIYVARNLGACHLYPDLNLF